MKERGKVLSLAVWTIFLSSKLHVLLCIVFLNFVYCFSLAHPRPSRCSHYCRKNVHGLGVVISAHIMPPHFFNKGLYITEEVYLGVLTNVVKIMDRNHVIKKAVCFPTKRCARLHSTFGAKLVVAQQSGFSQKSSGVKTTQIWICWTSLYGLLLKSTHSNVASSWALS